MALARGIAGFLGFFSLCNGLGALLGSRAPGDAWWIDLARVPGSLAMPLGIAAAAVLLVWAVAPSRWPRLGVAAGVAAGSLAGLALLNVSDFYGAAVGPGVAATVPVPLSLVVATGLAWVARAAARELGDGASASGRAALGVALALCVAFPVAQVFFFGTTDYRRPADAAVVFGAKAFADGRLSTALGDRVDTAVELYHRGLVATLVMTGGVGESGVDETAAMRDRAVALGVRSADIVCDPTGVNTDASVAGTLPLLRERGCSRVLAVSQFWHLPRIKMAYLAAGVDVQTVPAVGRYWIPQTPAMIVREIGGFWTYWARGLVPPDRAPSRTSSRSLRSTPHL